MANTTTLHATDDMKPFVQLDRKSVCKGFLNKIKTRYGKMSQLIIGWIGRQKVAGITCQRVVQWSKELNNLYLSKKLMSSSVSSVASFVDNLEYRHLYIQFISTDTHSPTFGLIS